MFYNLKCCVRDLEGLWNYVNYCGLISNEDFIIIKWG